MAGGGLQLFSIRGIPVVLDLTALLLIIFYAFSLSSFGLVVALGVAVGILLSILIHELAHALIGTWLGAQVAGIRLHLLGGATYFARKPASYPKDVIISLVGPASNLVLWQLLEFAQDRLLDTDSPRSLREIILIAAFLSQVNLFVGIFNALPGFPLDGGQAVYSFMQWITKREKVSATVVMVLGCISAVGILYWGTDGFNFRTIFSGGNLLFTFFLFYIVYWIASSSIALYRQAVSPSRGGRATPRQIAEMQQRETEKRVKSHPGGAAFEQGKAFLLSRDYEQAIDSFTQALELEPNEVSYLDYRAYTYAQMGYNEKAVEDYNRLIESVPNRADFYTARAQAYKNMGNYEAARADIEQALRINPTESYALQLKRELSDPV